ncbi:AP-4 complex accessory subunit Tepsin-like [Homarus americanus]|uniref:AP-4 complex accessory subunit Tepsin-like n=1 Tax=Homarus americanus TaxID=6706 RepID=A0A8J5JTL4_HOMAM|nr:AP-4 complex accessory subunit Tepsin-like [Homarus americanus]
MERKGTPLPFQKLLCTRWLVRGKVIYNILLNWEELKAYFAVTVPRADASCLYKAREALGMLEDPVNLLYFHYVSPIVTEFERVHSLFQTTDADPKELVSEHHKSLQDRILDRNGKPLPLNMVDYGAKFMHELYTFINQRNHSAEAVGKYPLLNKATVDNDTPLPGYLFEEIISILLEIVRILQHVCSRGHRGVRVYLRGKDGELRRVTASGGPPDPVLANTPQLFLSSAIQELLTLLFDPRTMKEDEIWMAGKENGEETTKSSQQSSFSQGYGSQASKGKYEGFGSSPINQGDNLVNQVRGIVERVMSPSGDTKKLGLDFLQGEKGDYQPLSLPSIGSSVPCLPQSSSHLHIPVLSTSHPTKYKAHRAGRAGGGWESDEDAQEASTSPLNSEIDLPIGLADHHPSEEQVAGVIEEEFLNCVVDPKITWPLDHDRLVELCQKCTVFDITLLLGKIDEKVAVLINSLHYLEVSQAAVSQDGPDGSQVTIDSEDKLELNFSSTKILTDNVTLPTTLTIVPISPMNSTSSLKLSMNVGPPWPDGCFDKLGRDNIDTNFWAIGDYNTQNGYLQALFRDVPVKRKRTEAEVCCRQEEDGGS